MIETLSAAVSAAAFAVDWGDVLAIAAGVLLRAIL